MNGRPLSTTLLVTLSVLLLCSASACGDDDAMPTDAAAGDDAGPEELCVPDSFPPDPGSCAPGADDYVPGADDSWAPCVSDDGRYHRVQPTISSAARVRAFEEIAELLSTPDADPSTDAFLQARMIYQEDEGLDSRVVRRYDPHFEVPEGTDCTADGVPAMFPDYCVGPAQIQPLILDALNGGIAGNDPRVNAARVEAGLLWFLYVSTYKESLTCTNKAKDCDSAYAYYTGGEPARCGIGLARYLAELDPHAHDRAWDGALAVRCWRDLDDGDVATMLELRDRAREQYDQALIDGVAAVLRDRLEQIGATTGDAQAHHWAFAQVLANPVLREMGERSPGDAATLRSEMERDDPAAADLDGAVAAIEATFDCP